MELENSERNLPTKEEFEEAEKHGIREILGLYGKWWWSSSVHPNYSDSAYFFNGNNGDVDFASRYSISDSVRCVQK